MISRFNHLKEIALKNALGVHLYSDVFIKMAESRSPIFRAVARKKAIRLIGGDKIVFIHIGKNAGTSINSILYRRNPGHFPASFYACSVPDIFYKCKSFAVLRDPVERFKSAARMFLQNGTRSVSIDPYFATIANKMKSAGDILHWICDNYHDPYRIDTTFRSQKWYLSLEDRVIVNRLFSLERNFCELDDYVHSVCGKKIPHINTTEKVDLALSSTEVSRIENLYADDLELFERI
ncbi:sulfotransferase family protein [Novosphingobium sp. KCTC 2891]|uniref:sulfotransferase family protein n=1 Tax=Novosphingobium sp. KCTC 2891 TaxID=2989730 RepID=UPI002221C93E|nr:sulfotransferase family protein [Novosphingobium sp. KCTC 2891]MCW1382320.1 sulfotransferase family protein [Novosphingobium sp. KCTC 2891]